MRLFFISTFIFFGITCCSQVCEHNELSKKYNFTVKFIHINDSLNKIELKVINKKDLKTIQNISIIPQYIFSSDFENCNTVRSYTTGFNKNEEVLDNNFGDFVVADFNFDGKEDFAIKIDSGGNGGPLYNYYLQKNDLKFKKDLFLSNTMEFFPNFIDSKNKTLITLVHANAYQLCKTTYKYYTSSKKWKKLKHSFESF